MKRLVGKFLVLAAAAALFAVMPAVAKANAAEAAEETPSNGQKMKEGSKEFFSGLGGTFKEAGHTIKDKAKEVTAAAYVGEWQFVNGKSTTYLDLTDDGDMSITQLHGSSSKVWTGTYTVSKKQIVFHVEDYNGKEMDEDWVIAFKASKDKEMKISCRKIPDDANGYSFKNTTLFTPVEIEDESAAE